MKNRSANGAAHKRRPSRLSEGRAIRPLDFTLHYEGKHPLAEVLSHPSTPSELRLSVRVSESEAWRNRLYAGENLGILQAMRQDPAVCGNVTLIYIDPPFATGSSFESRSAEQAYEDLHTGAAFLEFLRQRLILLRELLSPQGSIYLHLDSKMAFPVKIIMDEIFGPANFRNWITRKKSNRKNFTRKQYGNISDYLLFYTKTDHYTWHRPYETWTEEWIKTEYPYVEEATGRRYKKVPVHAPGLRNGETGKTWRGKLPPPGKHWQYPPATLEKMDARGEIYWSPTGNPRRKIYFDQSKGVPVQDIWMDFRDAHNQMIEVTGYPTEKNLDMLRRIVMASSAVGDLVLDCFAGSGTTLIAAEELQRRWIGMDSSLTAIETILKRLANGSEPMGDFVRGKKKQPKEAELFPRGVLQAGFGLYTSDSITPETPTASAVRRWADLFARYSASIPG